MDESTIELLKTLLPLLIAVISALVAWLENKKKREAINEVDYQTNVAEIASKQVDSLISPSSATADVIKSLPERAWKMSDETKRFLTSGAFTPYSQSILQQVAIAESAGQVAYVITVPNGVQYFIEYGLLKQQVGTT